MYSNGCQVLCKVMPCGRPSDSLTAFDSRGVRCFDESTKETTTNATSVATRTAAPGRDRSHAKPRKIDRPAPRTASTFSAETLSGLSDCCCADIAPMLPLNASHVYLLAAIAEQIHRTALPDESNGRIETRLVYIRGNRALMNYSSMVPLFKPIMAACVGSLAPNLDRIDLT